MRSAVCERNHRSHTPTLIFREIVQELLKIIAFLGSSGSGKTTTIEELIRGLDYRVGTVKFMHHERLHMEPDGKDTRRHINAGSKFTIGAARKETVITTPTDTRPEFSEVLQMVKVLPEVDLLIAESLFDVPENAGIVVSANDEDDLKHSLSRIKSPYENDRILAIVGRISEQMSEWQGIPCVSDLVDIVSHFMKS